MRIDANRLTWLTWRQELKPSCHACGTHVVQPRAKSPSHSVTRIVASSTACPPERAAGRKQTGESQSRPVTPDGFESRSDSATLRCPSEDDVRLASCPQLWRTKALPPRRLTNGNNRFVPAAHRTACAVPLQAVVISSFSPQSNAHVWRHVDCVNPEPPCLSAPDHARVLSRSERRHKVAESLRDSHRGFLDGLPSRASGRAQANWGISKLPSHSVTGIESRSDSATLRCPSEDDVRLAGDAVGGLQLLLSHGERWALLGCVNDSQMTRKSFQNAGSAVARNSGGPEPSRHADRRMETTGLSQRLTGRLAPCRYKWA